MFVVSGETMSSTILEALARGEKPLSQEERKQQEDIGKQERVVQYLQVRFEIHSFVLLLSHLSLVVLSGRTRSPSSKR